MPDPPAAAGVLGPGVPSAEAAIIIQAARFHEAPAVSDVVLAPSGQLAAVVADSEVALVKRVESSWKRLRLFAWDGGATVVMSEWANGAEAGRWRAQLSKEPGESW